MKLIYHGTNELCKAAGYQLKVSNKCAEYLKSLSKHRVLIRRAFDKYGRIMCQAVAKDDEQCSEYLTLLEIAVEVHDLSKYTKEEFTDCRKFLYPTEEEKEDINKYPEGYQRAYNNALWRHQELMSNHHWQKYFIHESNSLIEMPVVYAMEMVLDWIAHCEEENNLVYTWYFNGHEYEILLHKNTRGMVKMLIELIKKYDESTNLSTVMINQ